jgi:hypothetical protein
MMGHQLPNTGKARVPGIRTLEVGQGLASYRES